jgi:hypothetical protein
MYKKAPKKRRGVNCRNGGADEIPPIFKEKGDGDNEKLANKTEHPKDTSKTSMRQKRRSSAGFEG